VCVRDDGSNFGASSSNLAQLSSAKKADASKAVWDAGSEPSYDTSTADETIQNLGSYFKNALGDDNYNNIVGQMKEQKNKLQDEMKKGVRCPPWTGGTCAWSECDSSRGKSNSLSCANGMCNCKPGFCASGGVCVRDDGSNFGASSSNLAQLSSHSGKAFTEKWAGTEPSYDTSTADETSQNLGSYFKNALGDKNYNNIEGQMNNKFGDNWKNKLADEMKKNSARCPPWTGGTCTLSECDSSRGKSNSLSCTSNMCNCKPGFCASGGACVRDDGSNFGQ